MAHAHPSSTCYLVAKNRTFSQILPKQRSGASEKEWGERERVREWESEMEHRHVIRQHVSILCCVVCICCEGHTPSGWTEATNHHHCYSADDKRDSLSGTISFCRARRARVQLPSKYEKLSRSICTLFPHSQIAFCNENWMKHNQHGDGVAHLSISSIMNGVAPAVHGNTLICWNCGKTGRVNYFLSSSSKRARASTFRARSKWSVCILQNEYLPRFACIVHAHEEHTNRSVFYYSMLGNNANIFYRIVFRK